MIWAPATSIPKLLGAPFGITLETSDIDDFLKGKIKKKLKYSTSQRLSLAGHVIVVNAIFLSTIYYFIAIWSGSLQAIRDIHGSLRNFLCSGTEYACRTRVCWDDCCIQKMLGGLKLLDPKVSLTTLLAKWVIFAIEPDILNFRILFHYRISRMKPHPKSAFWYPNQSWLMIHRHSTIRSLRVWNRITAAWRLIVKYIELASPTNVDEVSTTNIWWATSYIGGNFNFYVEQARKLARQGLRTIGDL